MFEIEDTAPMQFEPGTLIEVDDPRGFRKICIVLTDATSFADDWDAPTPLPGTNIITAAINPRQVAHPADLSVRLFSEGLDKNNMVPYEKYKRLLESMHQVYTSPLLVAYACHHAFETGNYDSENACAHAIHMLQKVREVA